MWLTKTAIQRPIFILMLMVGAILLGYMAITSMRLEENPDVQFGVVSVTTIYPGAGPEEINELVTRPIEEAVSSVSNLLEVTGTSQEGVSALTLQFEVGTDMSEALNEVRSKVDRVITDLPEGTLKPTIDKIDTASSPILQLAVRSDVLSNRQLRDLAEDKLQDRFARVKGVAQVTVAGGLEREIQVRVSKDALLRYGVGILDIANALQRAGQNVPSGRSSPGEREFTVRMVNEFDSLEEIRNVRISLQDPDNPMAQPTPVRLGDVATVVDSNRDRRSYSRLNGSEAVMIIIQKAKEGNAVEISEAIQEKGEFGPSLLKQLESTYPIEFEVTLDSADRIEEGLTDLFYALMFGIALVTLVVFMFLHNLRGTLIVAIAIPICLMATLGVLWAFGFTLNNMTMLALALAIGVLVDDCIVVIENIYRHLTMGEPPVTAAIKGRGEIGLAAIAITAADIVVFLPIAFMGGVVGQFFKPLALGFAICVFLSLLVSFTVTPMLAARWYRRGEDWEHPKGRFAQWFERAFRRFASRYRGALAVALEHRGFVFALGFAVLMAVFLMIGGSFAPSLGAAIASSMLLVVVAVAITSLAVLIKYVAHRGGGWTLVGGLAIAAGFVAAPAIGYWAHQWKGEALFKFAFFPPSDTGLVNIGIELPPGASLEATAEVVEQIEAIAMRHPDVEYVVSSVGSGASTFSASSQGANVASVQAVLKDKRAIVDVFTFWDNAQSDLRTRRDTLVAGDLIQAIPRYPGVELSISAQSGFGFGMPIQISLTGADRDEVFRTAQRIRDGLAQGAIKGVITPQLSVQGGKPELQVEPDRAALGELGIAPAEVGLALRALYEGDDTAKFREEGTEYDIRVQMAAEARNDPNLLDEVPVTFRQGQPIYLSEVTDIERGVSLDKIDRRDRAQEIRVDADLLPGFAAGSVQAEIDDWVQDEGLVPASVTYTPLGQAQVQAREMIYLISALGLGFLLVYMVLAALYNNLLYPLVIQMAQPQALVGAILALIIFDKTLNIVGMVGIIALVGLVGKNAILLVDYTNTLRERGKDRLGALLEAAQTRMRPIMMTTLSLVAGMLPVALAIGRGSEFRETIGITIIGGILLSTVLTLFVIPCSYSIFDDASNLLSGFGRRKTAHDEVVTEEPSPTEPAERR